MLKEFILDYGIPIYNVLSEVTTNLYNKLTFNVSNIVRGYYSDELYFIECINAPYLSSYIRQNRLNGKIIWKYNLFTRTFSNYNCSYKDKKPLPVLMATVKLHNKEILDLTEFMNSVYVELSNCNYPNVDHVLGAYEYTYGIVLDRQLKYHIEILDHNMNIKTVPLFIGEDLVVNSEKN